MRLTCIFSKRRIKWLLITAVTSVMFFIMHVTMTNSTQYVSNMDIARLHAVGYALLRRLNIEYIIVIWNCGTYYFVHSTL